MSELNNCKMEELLFEECIRHNWDYRKSDSFSEFVCGKRSEEKLHFIASKIENGEDLLQQFYRIIKRNPDIFGIICDEA